MASRHFHELLDKMRETHDRKNHDYAKDSDPFSNFTFSAELVKHYNNPIDQIFIGIISIKLARLSELLNGKEAKNESIKDTFIDLANYCALWGAYYASLEDSKKEAIITTFKHLMEDGIKSYDELNQEQTYSIESKKCLKCPKTFMDMHLYCEHAIAMHAAIYNHAQGTLKFNDTLEVIPNLKFPKTDSDIPL